jgi:hypothetical protein
MIHYLITPPWISSSYYVIKVRDLFFYKRFNDKYYDNAYQALKDLNEILHGASAIIKIEK